MITLVLERDKADEERHHRVLEEMREQHASHMAEFQELRFLQKEHRIDIMAPFQAQNNLQEPGQS